MSIAEIDYALIQGYRDMGLSLPTAYEGEHFTPPKTDWAQVFIVPAGIDTYSLGTNGEDMHTGFMQIDFNIPPKRGRAQLLTYAQAVRDQFITGKGFTRNTQTVVITSVDRSPITTVDGFQRISMTVFFEATTIRPEI